MKRKLKIIFLIIFGTLVLLIFLGFQYFFYYRLAFLAQTISHAGVMLCEYAENKGTFPKNQQELEKEGYLKVQSASGKNEYFRKAIYFDTADPNGRKTWEPLFEFDKISIRYGFDANSAVCKDHILYDKRTNVQIFIVDGPEKKYVGTAYESVSYKIYAELLKR